MFQISEQLLFFLEDPVESEQLIKTQDFLHWSYFLVSVYS